jgi:hypothetical protein
VSLKFDAGEVVTMPSGHAMTRAKYDHHIRLGLIVKAHREGLDPMTIAEQFDLSENRIVHIIAEDRARDQRVAAKLRRLRKRNQ